MESQLHSTRGSLLLAVVLAATPLLCLLISGDFPVYTRGEGREGLVVRALLEGDSLVLPLRNGIDIPSKPPLYHWCAAIITKIGIFAPELSLRLPSALFALFVGLSLFLFLRNRCGDTVALTTTAITTCSFEWLRTAQSARVDMTFSALLIGAILILFRIFEDARPKLQSALLAGVLMGAACLAKGPAGIAIPIAIAGLYSVMSLARLKRNILPLALSMIIAGAISGVWYFLAYQVGGERFLEIQLFKENLARLAGDEDYDLGHNSGPLSIGGLLLVGTLPFSFLLIPIALGCWRWRRQIFPKQNPLFVYSLIWIAVFMFIFGIASSKRSVYLMGCFPACAFIINQLILKLSELEVAGTSKIRRLIIWMFALAAIICSKALLALFFAKGLVLSQIKSERLLNSITDILSHSGLLPGLGLIILVLWYLTFDQSRRTAVYGVWAIAVVSTLISAFTAIHVLPRISGQQSPKPFLAEASKQFGTARLVFMDDAYFSANYYSPRQLLPLSDLNKLNPGEAGYLLSRVKSENELPTGFEIFEIVAVSPTLNVQGKDRLTLNRIRKSE